ncbi:MAG: VCBS repeat-containing protein, partial [Planctomycetota bacterium]|nr:VCBS repeat-containing protein [Planctomycetota bacterium]
LVFPERDPPPAKSPFQFVAEPIVSREQTTPPLVASLAIHRLNTAIGRQLFTCDMASGLIEARTFNGVPGSALTLASAAQPCHLEPVDFDGDGVFEFVAAALGSYQPSDHNKGRVLLVRQRLEGGAKVEPEVLLDNVGRVADVRPADFDGDGDLDLAGRILLLRNQGGDQKTPRFEVEVLDDRHGTIHVPICDLNSDGQPDFIACISQDQETIVAFLNDGAGGFEKKPLFAANDPAYGSNGIELIDLDRDGDLDVLYTNGDTLDSRFLKPYHSVQWLENRGEFPFTHHHIDAMAGVSRALAGDFDGDGDLDIFAVAYFPVSLRNLADSDRHASAIILENTGNETFVRHILETGNPEHMCLELADVDDDGD